MLADDEAADLKGLEARIRDASDDFIAVGTALVEIRDRKLYRKKYARFDDYCRDSFGISNTRAFYLIGCAEVFGDFALVQDLQIKPANQAQLRCLITVPRAKRLLAWKKVLKLAGQNKITSDLVAKVAATFDPLFVRTETKGMQAVDVESNLHLALKLLGKIEALAGKGQFSELGGKLTKLRNCLKKIALANGKNSGRPGRFNGHIRLPRGSFGGRKELNVI